MRNNRELAELYRLLRRRNPAASMMVHAVGAMIVLLAWASIAPISEVVSHRVKIVPSNGLEGDFGSHFPSSPVGGMVAEVVVAESAQVEQGDLLLRFDSDELILRREGEFKKQKSLQNELDAKLRQIQLANRTFVARAAELAAEKRTEQEKQTQHVAERKIKMQRAEAELQLARKELSRGIRLQEGRAISDSELAELRAACANAFGELELVSLPVPKTKIDEIEKRIKALESSHDEEVHLIEAEKLLLESRFEAVESEISVLDLKISQCSIHAPRAGVVSQCQLRRGDWIPPGEIGIAISQQGHVAEAILPSRLICDVTRGSKARITLDGVDWLIHGSLTATVTEVSPDLQKEETVLGDGSTEVIDGYRVLLQFEPNDEFKKWDNIRLGMIGSVEIDVGEKRLATYLLEKAVGTHWLPGN